ncbi:unnamed protein product [Diabrotica balteata]|uniref:DUF659 domain-containing protein n=1 Tax=Diabrotica balteata TaxID=107213 RepID=A0A9N9SZ36_DIABA|nr:unnamed protein product [Diabrotica balteata]
MKVLVLLSLVALSVALPTLLDRTVRVKEDGTVSLFGSRGIEIDILKSIVDPRIVEVVFRSPNTRTQILQIEEPLRTGNMNNRYVLGVSVDQDYNQADVLVNIFRHYQGTLDDTKYYSLLNKIQLLVKAGLVNQTIYDIIKNWDLEYRMQGVRNVCKLDRGNGNQSNNEMSHVSIYENTGSDTGFSPTVNPQNTTNGSYEVMEDGSLAIVTGTSPENMLDGIIGYSLDTDAALLELEENNGVAIQGTYSIVENMMLSTTDTESSNLTNLSTPTSSSTSYTSTNKRNLFATSQARPAKKSKKITDYMDILQEYEEEKISTALAKFIFGCNLPFTVVESPLFKNFIKTIRPAYLDKIPGRKKLCTSLLNKCYEDCIEISRKKVETESVILCDGWKNSSTNSKTVVTMLHSADGKNAFLDAWDLTTESETGEKLAEIITESKKIAKEKYDVDAYGIVSDNASAMIKMGSLLKHNMWHSTCSSHTGNLLAKDVLDKKLVDNVVIVLKEFKQPDLEKMIVDKGGRRIQLPAETRWCSYRDSFKSLLENLVYMKQVAAVTKKKIKPKVKELIFNDEFVDEIQQNIEIYEPICNLINACQKSDTSVADAVHLWLNLNLPDNLKEKLKHRQQMALNVYALTAYYLHPKYENSKLTSEHTGRITQFLLRKLCNQGIEEWDKFNTKSVSAKARRDSTLFHDIVPVQGVSALRQYVGQVGDVMRLGENLHYGTQRNWNLDQDLLQNYFPLKHFQTLLGQIQQQRELQQSLLNQQQYLPQQYLSGQYLLEDQINTDQILNQIYRQQIGQSPLNRYLVNMRLVNGEQLYEVPEKFVNVQLLEQLFVKQEMINQKWTEIIERGQPITEDVLYEQQLINEQIEKLIEQLVYHQNLITREVEQYIVKGQVVPQQLVYQQRLVYQQVHELIERLNYQQLFLNRQAESITELDTISLQRWIVQQTIIHEQIQKLIQQLLFQQTHVREQIQVLIQQGKVIPQEVVLYQRITYHYVERFLQVLIKQFVYQQNYYKQLIQLLGQQRHPIPQELVSQYFIIYKQLLQLIQHGDIVPEDLIYQQRLIHQQIVLMLQQLKVVPQQLITEMVPNTQERLWQTQSIFQRLPRVY